jgi:uncharacterized phage protein (TIGR01671 family)
METERRKYRFRAWHKVDHKVYPVVWYGRGGLRVLEEGAFEKTCQQEQVVLMQYTGVTDIAGREIYEGDIVEFVDDHGQKSQARVELNDGSFCRWSLAGDLSYSLNRQLVQAEHIVVIGDIYRGINGR